MSGLEILPPRGFGQTWNASVRYRRFVSVLFRDPLAQRQKVAPDRSNFVACALGEIHHSGNLKQSATHPPRQRITRFIIASARMELLAATLPFTYRIISGGSVSYFHMLWGDLGRFGLHAAQVLLESPVFPPKLKVGNTREKVGAV